MSTENSRHFEASKSLTSLTTASETREHANGYGGIIREEPSTEAVRSRWKENRAIAVATHSAYLAKKLASQERVVSTPVMTENYQQSERFPVRKLSDHPSTPTQISPAKAHVDTHVSAYLQSNCISPELDSKRYTLTPSASIDNFVSQMSNWGQVRKSSPDKLVRYPQALRALKALAPVDIQAQDDIHKGADTNQKDPSMEAVRNRWRQNRATAEATHKAYLAKKAASR